MTCRALQSSLLALALFGAAAHPVRAQAVFPPPERPPVVEAVRAGDGAVTIDGRLDEAAWQRAAPAENFVQAEPRQGAPASMGTEVRVLFDEQHLYVGVFCRDTTGREGLRVPDLQRDFDYFQHDLFGVSLDPFRDGRNSVAFQVNPRGAQRDLQVLDGSIFNRDWDAVWKVRTTVSDSGWTAEIALPWSTLRYPRGGGSWGINFVRTLRRAGEISGWSAWPRVYTPYQMAYAGRLEGVEPPPPQANLQVKPYLVTRADRSGDAAFPGDPELDLGGDLKWAVTPSTVLDLTVNTDFAQAEADRQVINTTRFSVFFPEKRSFFLENASLFEVGSSYSVLPFFSRRIGLDAQGRPVPIDAGARLTTRTSRRSAGALVLRQRGSGEAPASTFAVGRYLQNLGAQSSLGALVTARYDEAEGADGDGRDASLNTVAAVDGFFRFSKTAALRAMASRSFTEGAGGEGYAGQVWLYNEANWGYVGHIQGLVTERYNAASSFVRRRDLVVTSPAVTLDARPAWRPRFVRRFQPGATGFFYHRASDRQFQEGSLTLRPATVELQNGSVIRPYAQPNWQRLEAEDAALFQPFGIALQAGRYRYLRYGLYAASDLSRPLSASVDASAGGYFDGTLQTVEADVSAAPSPHAALSLRYELNRVRGLGLRAEGKTTHLLGPELRLALNPRVQFTAFYQYNTLADLAAWNVRFGYEFRPLSYLYLVFSDARYYVPTATRRAAPERFDPTQQVIFKLTYLAQF